MKNNQIFPNRSANEDQETVSQIKKGLESFDEVYSIEVPQVSFFEQRIKVHREKARKKWRKELFLFTVTAALILSFLLLALVLQPEIFLTVQVITVVFSGVYTFYVKRKVEVNHEQN